MRRLVYIGVALSLMGCATQNGGFSERDRIVLEGRIDDLESAQSRHITKIQSLEKRVMQLEDMITLLSRRTSVDTREVVRIEPESNRVSTNFERTVAVVPEEDDVYEELVISEEKKRAYFGTGRSSSSSSSSSSKPTTLKPYENVTTEKLPSASSQAKSANEVAPNKNASPMAYYQEGIDLYRQGNFADARARFETFLATKPDESYIDNALYWIGECFYGEGLFHEAAGYFHRIVQEYPTANKVPDALLKVSLTYQKLGKLDSAREMLRYLMDAFPGTEAARIGKEKYESLNVAQ